MRDATTHRAPNPWLMVGVTLAILAALVMSVPPGRVVGSLGLIGLGPTILAVILALVDGLILDADKFRRVARHLGFPIAFREAASLTIPTTALGLVAPFQTDELLKARMFNMRYGHPWVESVGVVGLDRGFNLVSHAALLAGGLLALSAAPGRGWVGMVLMIVGTFAVGILILAMVRVAVSLRCFTDHRLFGPLLAPCRTISKGFALAIWGYAVVADLLLVGALAVMAESTGLQAPLAAIVVFRHGSILLAKVPITVGGYGLREGSLSLGLAAYGDPASAVAVGLWFGVCTALIPSLVALLFRPFMREALIRVQDDLVLGKMRWSDLFRHSGREDGLRGTRRERGPPSVSG